MENIEQILSKLELTDEQVSVIVAGVKENYRTIAETEQKATRIAELEAQAAETAKGIESLKAQGEEVEALKQQIADYQKAEAENAAKAEAERELTDFTAKFDAAVAARQAGVNEFQNELVRGAILEKVHTMCKADVSLGIGDAIEQATASIDGIWKNAQKAAHNMPDVSANNSVIADKDKEALAKFMFRA